MLRVPIDLRLGNPEARWANLDLAQLTYQIKLMEKQVVRTALKRTYILPGFIGPVFLVTCFFPILALHILHFRSVLPPAPSTRPMLGPKCHHELSGP